MKKYQVIYADPPWRLQSMSSSAWNRSRKGFLLQEKYPLLSTEEINNLPVKEIADDNCSLFLWCTHSTIPDALEVMKAWGFKYHCLITWDKGSGFSLWGFHRRTEFLMYRYKGKINVNQKGRYIPTLITEKKTKHSRKPEAAYTLIESNAPTPRIELFAREKREGWDVWGNEVKGDIIL